MIDIPNMLMVGAGDRNAGKTEFVCSLIKKLSSQHDIVGIKVTTIKQADNNCPRGQAGCDVCPSLKGNFGIVEETDSQSNKDTCKMLAAGAVKVFWLRALKTHLKEAIMALQDVIGNTAISICESNSLRQVVEPGLFFMLKSREALNCKASAKKVVQYADRTVFFDGSNFDINLNEIKLVDGRWANKIKATAIIMAGGKSRRMGLDKGMLPIDNKPMVKYIFEQLKSHFDQILISSNDLIKYSFLGVEVVPDEVADKGPLVGIASALRVSVNKINFVIACDIPEVDISFIRKMVRESKAFDAVIPRTGPSQYEPLFAVYKKTTLAAIDKAIAAENYRIIAPLDDCKVNYIDLASDRKLKNLNTAEDYQKFIAEKKRC